MLLLFKRIIFFFLPFLILIGAFEFTLRKTLTPRFFDAIEANIYNEKKLDYLFLGASRAAVSVDPLLFGEYIGKKTNTQVNTLNIARGGLTIAEYYLGLKKILKQFPGKLNGTKIFIEADGLVVENDTWDSNGWSNPSARGSLVDVLMLEDLPALLKSNTTDKYIACAEYFFPLELYRKKWYIRDFLIKWRLENLINKYFPANNLKEKKIAEKGGVRTDKEGILLTRKKVIEETKKKLSKKIEGWENSILLNLIGLAKSNNIEVVFFQAAESSLYFESYKDPVHLHNQLAFQQFLKQHKLKMVIPPCRFPDEDFPDLSHLAEDKAPQFTRCLVDEYLLTKNKH